MCMPKAVLSHRRPEETNADTQKDLPLLDVSRSVYDAVGNRWKFVGTLPEDCSYCVNARTMVFARVGAVKPTTRVCDKYGRTGGSSRYGLLRNMREVDTSKPVYVLRNRQEVHEVRLPARILCEDFDTGCTGVRKLIVAAVRVDGGEKLWFFNREGRHLDHMGGQLPGDTLENE